MQQEVFRDGNDALILEALVNFFFIGKDDTNQVCLIKDPDGSEGGESLLAYTT